jgi:hypothetical protein
VQALRTGRPDRSWLNHVADRIGIRIKNPQKIDALRVKACNKDTVGIFFDRFSALMRRPRCLILNCDETHISSRKNFKVVSDIHVPPLTREAPKFPHFSAMCTISASGHAFEPTIILPEYQNLPIDLDQFQDQACFIRTPNGWMTQVSFLLYCHILLYQLSLYRQTLPIQHRGSRFLLILDGHPSRFTYDALNLLNESGVDVLILPAHCTHVLQPFDVSVASSAKTFLKRFLEIWRITLDQHNSLEVEEADMSWLAGKREQLIDAFLKAWSSAATLFNIEAGFRASGIWPLDRNEPLENEFVSEPNDDSLYPGRADDPTQMHCAHVTSGAVLGVLKSSNSRIMTAYTGGVEVTDPIKQLSRLLTVKDPDGTWFGGPSPFLWDIGIERSRLAQAADPRQWWFDYWPAFSPTAVSMARGSLSAGLATLVICRNLSEVGQCYAWFLDHKIEHIVFCPEDDEEIDGGDGVEPGNRQARVDTARQNRRRGAQDRPVLHHKYEPWLRFQDGPCDLCFTTGDSVRGLYSVRRLQLIYTCCPDRTLLDQTHMGSNNIFICFCPDEEGDLESLPEGFQPSLHLLE